MDQPSIKELEEKIAQLESKRLGRKQVLAAMGGALILIGFFGSYGIVASGVGLLLFAWVDNWAEFLGLQSLKAKSVAKEKPTQRLPNAPMEVVPGLPLTPDRDSST